MSMYKCPDCGHVDESVDYQMPQTEYGTYDINSESCSHCDVESSGDVRYFCGECSAEHSLDEFIELYEDECEVEEETSDLVDESTGHSKNTVADQIAVITNIVVFAPKFKFCKKCSDLFIISNINDTLCEACSTP